MRKCIRDKKRRKSQDTIKEYSMTSKGSTTFQETNLQEEEYSSPRKNEKGEVITSKKGIANVFGEFYKKLYDDDKYDETELEHEENETEKSIDDQGNDAGEMKGIPEITS